MASPSRKLIYLFNWPLLVNLLLLLAMGLINLYSATASARGSVSPFFISQLLYTAMGLALMVLMLCFHYRFFHQMAWPLYLVSLLLLLLVVLSGKTAGGQKNWLEFGAFRIQPSEFAKLGVILMLSRIYHRAHENTGGTGGSLWKPLAILAAPLILILMEKDVGSALFFVLIGITYFTIAGIRLRWLAAGLLLLVLVGAVGYRSFMSDYQRGRIQTFFRPEADPRGKGYHLLQSKIAVGSGRLTGKGYLQGSLNKFKFLPERHTDFVFSVLAEEWGMVGTSLTVAAFSAFFLLLLQAAAKAKDSFGGFLIVGVAALLFWQTAVNLGGVLGLLPLAGVTLPFFSYGGSSLITDLIGMGMVFNVSMRRYVF